MLLVRLLMRSTTCSALNTTFTKGSGNLSRERRTTICASRCGCEDGLGEGDETEEYQERILKAPAGRGRKTAQGKRAPLRVPLVRPKPACSNYLDICGLPWNKKTKTDECRCSQKILNATTTGLKRSRRILEFIAVKQHPAQSQIICLVGRRESGKEVAASVARATGASMSEWRWAACAMSRYSRPPETDQGDARPHYLALAQVGVATLILLDEIDKLTADARRPCLGPVRCSTPSRTKTSATTSLKFL